MQPSGASTSGVRSPSSIEASQVTPHPLTTGRLRDMCIIPCRTVFAALVCQAYAPVI